MNQRLLRAPLSIPHGRRRPETLTTFLATNLPNFAVTSFLAFLGLNSKRADLFVCSGLTVDFNNFSVISRRCLVVTGSSMLNFIVLSH